MIAVRRLVRPLLRESGAGMHGVREQQVRGGNHGTGRRAVRGAQPVLRAGRLRAGGSRRRVPASASVGRTETSTADGRRRLADRHRGLRRRRRRLRLRRRPVRQRLLAFPGHVIYNLCDP